MPFNLSNKAGSAPCLLRPYAEGTSARAVRFFRLVQDCHESGLTAHGVLSLGYLKEDVHHRYNLQKD